MARLQFLARGAVTDDHFRRVARQIQECLEILLDGDAADIEQLRSIAAR